MPDAFARLVRLLARLEDELPYVTVDDVCQRWEPAADAAICGDLIAQCIADRRLFTDQRHRYDLTTGSYNPVRLVRLNRRHADVAALLS
jgi:hypothetical protein